MPRCLNCFGSFWCHFEEVENYPESSWCLDFRLWIINVYILVFGLRVLFLIRSFLEFSNGFVCF